MSTSTKLKSCFNVLFNYKVWTKFWFEYVAKLPIINMDFYWGACFNVSRNYHSKNQVEIKQKTLVLSKFV